MTTPNTVAKRFDVRNLAEGEAEVYLYNAIGNAYDGVTARQFIDAVIGLGPNLKTLTLNINSPGGSVYDADAIVNYLARHPAAKVANIDGLAASAACTIAMACPTRNIAANAMMMVHRVADFAFGNADEMRQTADVLDKLDKTVCDAYARATGQTAEKCGQLMDAETWMGADEAKNLGFATAVVGEKKAAALAGMTGENVAKLHYKHTEKLSSLVVSGEATPIAPAPAPAAEETANMAKDTKAGESPAAPAEPINLAEHVRTEGARFKAAFGPENGARYFADGMTYEAAQAQHATDLAAANVAKDARIVELEAQLAASNKALGTDPLSADVTDPGSSEQTPDQAKLASLMRTFNNDEKRARKAFNSWKKLGGKPACLSQTGR
jgi:ATP-dependent protease ClpP protease subunit